jgi:hypothetical protein
MTATVKICINQNNPTIITDNFKEHFRYKQHGQSSGLPPVASFVPLGCSSRSSAEKASFLRSTGTSQHKKKEQLRKKAALFFALFRSSSPHGRFLRSSGLLHPQYRFIPFRSVNYAPLHSSSIMSVAPYFFGGCSFAQPSGLVPFALHPKSRNAPKRG